VSCKQGEEKLWGKPAKKTGSSCTERVRKRPSSKEREVRHEERRKRREIIGVTPREKEVREKAASSEYVIHQRR